MHIDMDAFFASVEQREHPEFQGKPVVVGADPQGGRGRGVVAACSYEARVFGLHSAMPIGQAYQLCPHAIYVRPDGSLYRKVSSQIRAIFERYTDLVEPVSIDEAFLDITGSIRLFGSSTEIARRIKQDIKTEQHLNCSIGLASNKFIAKIISDMSKPNGFKAVPTGTEQDFLADLPVTRMWGIGPKTEAQLTRLGVRTIGEITHRPRAFWEERFGKHGVHLWQLAHGQDDRPVTPEHQTLSISQETTFAEDTRDIQLLHRTLLALAEGVTGRARKTNVKAKTVNLKLRYGSFATYTRQRTLPRPTDDVPSVYRVLQELLQAFTPLPQPVRLIGAGLTHLEEPQEVQQGSLFDPPPEKQAIDQSMDRIRERFGMNSIMRASLLEPTPKKPSAE